MKKLLCVVTPCALKDRKSAAGAGQKELETISMQAKLSDITQENKHCKHIEKPLKKALRQPLKTIENTFEKPLKARYCTTVY